ncbi:MAG TPA: carboxypeptidase-like regulatory domain-containing protein [Candidatus Acidoferrum sp.]|jgi:hypothetical protein
MNALIFFFVLLSAQLRAGASYEAPPAGRIAGVVVNAVTNAPVPRAEVSIVLENQELSIKTGADGRFQFDALKAAKYQLYASAPGYIREGYNQHGTFFTGIAVGTGFDSEHLAFRLHPQALIYGRVTDDYGDPVRNAAVQIVVSGISGGTRGGAFQNQTQTDDLGEYRFAHLVAGKYRVAVQTRPWYSQPGLNFQSEQPRDQPYARWLNSTPPKPDPRLDVVYPVTFYPGVSDPHAATELNLSAGATEQANIPLHAVPAVHVRLRNLPLEENGVSIGASQPTFGNSQVGMPVVIGRVSPGEYEVAGLPPGQTIFQITRNVGGEQVPETLIAEISGDDTLDAARTGPSANLSGRLITAQPVPCVEAAHVMLVGENQSASTTLRKDCSFSIPGVQAGTYKVQMAPLFGGEFIQSLRVSGAHSSGSQITIDRSGDVQLTITMGAGFAYVSGVAKLADKAFDGAMILAVPASGENLEDDFRMDQSDSDGTFALYNVIPGKYFLVAIRDGWDLDWRDPQVLKPYLEKAMPLQFGSGETKQVTVEVQPTKKTP